MPIRIDNRSHEALKNEYKILCELFNKFKDDTVFNVVKPLAFFEYPPALITEESHGNRLSTTIKHGAKLFPLKKRLKLLSDQCKKCGQWLRHFQNVTVDINKKKFIFTDELDFINNQLLRCKKNNLLPIQLLNLVGEYLKKSIVPEQVQDDQIFGMHADFVHSNILVADQNITVLDFSNFREGHQLRDVATYLYSLDKFTSNPLFRKKVIDTLKNEFLNGYACDNLSEQVSILKLFQIREILGGLLSFSDQSFNKYRKKIKLKMLQIYSNTKLNDLIN